MNWLDIAVLVVILGLTASSFVKGFTREAVRFAASILGLLLAIWTYRSAGSWLLPFVSSPGVANFCGFVMVFLGVTIAGAVVGWLLSRAMRAVGLSWFDRVLGGAFGFLRGVLVCVALVMVIMAFTPGVKSGSAPQPIVRSRFAPYLIDASRLLSRAAPYELKEGFRKSYEQVKRIWRESVGDRLGELPATEL